MKITFLFIVLGLVASFAQAEIQPLICKDPSLVDELKRASDALVQIREEVKEANSKLKTDKTVLTTAKLGALGGAIFSVISLGILVTDDSVSYLQTLRKLKAVDPRLPAYAKEYREALRAKLEAYEILESKGIGYDSNWGEKPMKLSKSEPELEFGIDRRILGWDAGNGMKDIVKHGSQGSLIPFSKDHLIPPVFKEKLSPAELKKVQQLSVRACQASNKWFRLGLLTIEKMGTHEHIARAAIGRESFDEMRKTTMKKGAATVLALSGTVALTVAAKLSSSKVALDEGELKDLELAVSESEKQVVDLRQRCGL